MPTVATSERIVRYWEQFLASLPPQVAPPCYVEAFFFGTRSEGADQITRLVLDGTKTATGALLWALEADGEKPAEPGDLWIVTNGGDDPACVIETIDVRVLPFQEVGEEYAWWGGEGDRALPSWRDLYWDYIVAECERLGREADRRAPLVMERFRVVYAEPLAP
jgi:uncharacterized protein YhfF